MSYTAGKSKEKFDPSYLKIGSTSKNVQSECSLCIAKLYTIGKPMEKRFWKAHQGTQISYNIKMGTKSCCRGPITNFSHQQMLSGNLCKQH